MNEKITELSLSYNLPPYVFGLNTSQRKLYCLKKGINYPETCKARENPKILHSYGLFGIKPWMKNNVNPYNHLFRKYVFQVDDHFELIDAPAHIPLINSRDKFYQMLLARAYMPDVCHQPLKKIMTKVFMKNKE